MNTINPIACQHCEKLFKHLFPKNEKYIFVKENSTTNAKSATILKVFKIDFQYRTK